MTTRYDEAVLLEATKLIGIQLSIANSSADFDNPVDDLLAQHAVDPVEIASALEAMHERLMPDTDLGKFGGAFILGFIFGLNAETVAKGREADR